MKTHAITATISEKQVATWTCSCGASDWVCTEYLPLVVAAQSHAPSIEPIRLTILSS